MGSFWQLFWIVIEIFLLMTYLIFLVQIISDLLRDSSLGGGARAVWMILLILVPFVAALAYLVSRGGGMEERRRRAAVEELRIANIGPHGYFGAGLSNEISNAFTLLEDGAITQKEYDALKAQIIAV